ncbi:MAG: AsmA-like C-terminal region-containing protein [Candidatus Omnitrophota bacterium]
MKKIIIFVSVFLILIILANLAVSFFLPKTIKTAVLNYINDYLGKDAKISSLKANLLKGVAIEGLTIIDKESKEPQLSIKELKILPFYPTLFGKRKIFFSIQADELNYTLVRKKDNTFDIPSIKENNKKQSFFLPRNIIITNLNFAFDDRITGFKKKFDGIHLSLSLKVNSSITLEGNWKEKIKASGRYNLKDKNTEAKIILKDIDISELKPYIKNFEIKSGLIQNATFNISKNKPYFIEGILNAENLILIKDSMVFSGGIQISPKITLPLVNPVYKAEIKVNNGSVENIASIGSLTDIILSCLLENSKLEIIEMRANALGNPVTAKGTITLPEGDYKIDIKSNTSLKKLRPLAAKLINYNFSSQGKEAGASFNTVLNNLDQNLNDADASIDCSLKGGIAGSNTEYSLKYRVDKASYKQIKNIGSEGLLSNNELDIERLSFSIMDLPFHVKGKISNFRSPDINLSLNLDGIESNIKGIISNRAIDFSPISVTAGNTELKSLGRITLDDAPLINFEGSGYADFEDFLFVIRILSEHFPWLRKIKPIGDVNVKFALSKDAVPGGLNIKLFAQSNFVNLYNVIAENAELILAKDKDGLYIPGFKAKIFDGETVIAISLDKSSDSKTIKVSGRDLELANCVKQLKLKNKKMSGKASFEVSLSSKHSNFTEFDSLKGEGTIMLKEGNIWEIDLLRGLGEFIFIGDFETIRFKEGCSDLIFRGKKVLFENIQLKSPQMSLSGNGSISLDGHIDFVLIPDFNPVLMSNTEGIKKFITEFMGKSGMAIKVQGTIKKPTYKVISLLTTPLKGLQNLIESLIK